MIEFTAKIKKKKKKPEVSFPNIFLGTQGPGWKSEEQCTAPLKLDRICTGCIDVYRDILDIYRIYTGCLVSLEKQTACLGTRYVPNSVAFFIKDD